VTHPFAAWIKQLAAEGITGGCGGGNYCPNDPVTRGEMAVFLLRAEHGGSYTPPAVGDSTGFNDVPVTHLLAAWIKQLAVEGITTGCGNGNYCPNAAVTRGQMAIFLVKLFNSGVSGNVCAFNPTAGLVFATSMEHPYWYQLANRGNSASVLAPYPPNRVYYSYPNNVSVVENPVIKGLKAQQFQNIAGTHEPSAAFKYALPRSDIYYWRFYRQYEPGYQFTCESKAFSIYAHNPITFSLPAGERPDGTNEVSCFLQIMPNCWYDNRAHVQRCFDPVGVYDRGEPVLYCYHLDQPTGYGEKFRQNIGEPRYITSGQWIDFQMMMKLNTPGQADGEIKLWIDGELKMHYNTIRFRTIPELQLNAAALGGYIGGTCTSARDQKIWDDHYMISKVFITDQVFGAMCETKTEWFDTGVPYLWDLTRQCWPGVTCP